MLEIKVAGPGCRNCLEVKARVARVLSGMRAESVVRELKEVQEIAEAGIMMTPGLIVNGKIVSQGKIPTEDQIRGWFLEAMKS